MLLREFCYPSLISFPSCFKCMKTFISNVLYVVLLRPFSAKFLAWRVGVKYIKRGSKVWKLVQNL